MIRAVATRRKSSSSTSPNWARINTDARRFQPPSSEIRDFYTRAQFALVHDLLQFNEEDVQTLACGFAQTIKKHRYTCYACAIMPDHIHLVIRKHRDRAGDDDRKVSGGIATEIVRAKRQAAEHPVWGGPGWKVFLDTIEAVERTIEYVRRNPVKIHRPDPRTGTSSPPTTPGSPAVTPRAPDKRLRFRQPTDPVAFPSQFDQNIPIRFPSRSLAPVTPSPLPRPPQPPHLAPTRRPQPRRTVVRDCRSACRNCSRRRRRRNRERPATTSPSSCSGPTAGRRISISST